MADTEKSSPPHNEGNDEVVLPPGRLYKSTKLFGIRIPWYASPETQVVLVAFVCFLCPGKQL